MFVFCSHNRAHTANNMYKKAGGNILLILRVRSIARLLMFGAVRRNTTYRNNHAAHVS